MVRTTEQAGVVPHLGGLEAERLQHRYLGPSTYSSGCCPRVMIRFLTATIPRVACCAAMAWTL